MDAGLSRRDKARSMLEKAAKTRHGSITVGYTLDGTSVAIGNEELAESQDRRTLAELEAEIEYLKQRGFMKTVAKGRSFEELEITSLGYKALE